MLTIEQVCRLFIYLCCCGYFCAIASRAYCISFLNNHECQIVQQDTQLSQRDRAAECVIVFAKTRRLELGNNFTDIIGLSSTTVI